MNKSILQGSSDLNAGTTTPTELTAIDGLRSTSHPASTGAQPKNARLVAIYLPQFYTFPENDRWWGKGFTEWTNVTKARALFRGHHQPNLPSDLGFCDLRIPEVRQAQADLARENGIEGFSYWHYWFHGDRLLERPFDEVLNSGEPDFPFCLAWANEEWKRSWTGRPKELLKEQRYSPADHLNHARWLAKAFSDPRYIKVDGRPVFTIYNLRHLEDPERSLEIYRNEIVRLGIPNPYLIGCNAHATSLDARTLGFDAVLDFQPQLGILPNFAVHGQSRERLRQNLRQGIWNSRLKIYDEVQFRKQMSEQSATYPYPYHPCVFVSWDNTPRLGDNGVVLLNSSPQLFEDYLLKAVSKVQDRPDDQRLVFVNAWNEWAEGNYLEPDQRWGTGYLESVRRVNARSELRTK